MDIRSKLGIKTEVESSLDPLTHDFLLAQGQPQGDNVVQEGVIRRVLLLSMPQSSVSSSCVQVV